MSVSSEIFFHVGTGKTGTTFLQYRVFPKFEGLYYIQRTRYRHVEKIIRRGEHSRYFMSNEFDQQMEREVRKLSAAFPDATPVVVFRRHDSYIASQYRRFVKNGFAGSFRAFFDLSEDAGFFKKHDLDFTRQIQLLEGAFSKPPIVYSYHDMRENPAAFVLHFAARLGASIDLSSVDFSRKHTSYNEQQLKAVQWMGRFINMRKRRVFSNGVLHFLWRLYLGAIRYTTLFVGKLLPSSWFSSQPLMAPSELEAVREYFAADWEQVLKRKEEISE